MQSSDKTPIFLKPTSSSYLFITIDFTKMAYVLGFSPAEIPLNSLETLIKDMVQAYQTLEISNMLPISFANKRLLEERFNNLASEMEQKVEKFPGFSKIHSEIQEINVEMQKNITKMIFQQENLLQMEKKTEKMAEIAGKFKENATDLRIKHTENCSVGFWILMAVLLFIIFIVLIVILACYSDTEETPEANTIDISIQNLTNITTTHFMTKGPAF